MLRHQLPPTLYILLILLSIFNLPAWAVLPTAGTWVTEQNREFTISPDGVISNLTLELAVAGFSWNAHYDAIQINPDGSFSVETSGDTNPLGYAKEGSITGTFSSAESVTFDYSATVSYVWVVGEEPRTVNGSGRIIATLGHGKPNLTPCRFEGWSDEIMVSHEAQPTSGAVLRSIANLYVHWAVCNRTPIDSGAYVVDLYIDDVKKGTVSVPAKWAKADIGSDYETYSIGLLPVGTHTVKIVADSTGAVAETNENDNIHEKTIEVIDDTGGYSEIPVQMAEFFTNTQPGNDVEQYYYFVVPVSTKTLQFELSYNSPWSTLFLFARSDTKPGHATGECQLMGVRRDCTISNPKPGVWWVMITGGQEGDPYALMLRLDDPSTYTATATAGENGSISPSSRTVEVGEVATFTVTPDPGYVAIVNGCSGTLSGNTYTTSPMTAPCAIDATFAATYSLTVAKAGSGSGTVNSNPEGINCGSDCTQYTSGTRVTLTATPASGSTFAGWSGAGCSGAGTCTVLMDAAKSFTATFNGAGPPGDVNGDGKVDALDVVAVINHFLGSQTWPQADVTGDGKVDALDVVFVINQVLGV